MRLELRGVRRISSTAASRASRRRAGPVQARQPKQSPQTASPASTAAFERALRGEKKRSEQELNDTFQTLRKLQATKEDHKTFPRRLQDKTFFTPHMQREALAPSNRSIETEYAVVLPGQAVAIRQPSNPVRQPLGSLPQSTLSGPQLESIHRLEKQGWQFIGLNGDILVFEKQSNARKDSVKQAVRAGVALTAGVAIMTGVLYIGEALATHRKLTSTSS